MAVSTHQTAVPARAPLLIETGWFPLVALIANVTAIIVVNFWIYHARALFIAGHPDYVAQQPPTISRAISDPAIGEPFAIWISGSGILLILGVGALALVYLRLAAMLPDQFAGLRRVLRACVTLLFAMQTLSALGMYLLSNYRFPDGDEMHMLGSYIFFGSQASVVIVSLVLGLKLRRNRDALDNVAGVTLPGARMMGWRIGAAVLVIAMAVGYVSLFVAKGFDFGAANVPLYRGYVLLEPALISGFLLVLALYQTDLWALARRRG